MTAIDEASKGGNVAPAGGVFLITPNDSADLSQITRAISFGTAGALKITDALGNTVTIPSGALAAGILHPIRVVKVFSTGTGASSIVGYY